MNDIKGTSQAVERREHDLQKQAKRVILTDPFGGILTEGNFTVRFAESGSDFYIGKAQIGSLDNESVWQIRKVTENGIFWANGTDAFVNKWSDRETYEYR